MRDLILCGPALLPDDSIAVSRLHLSEGKIKSIEPCSASDADITTEGFILPGFIDLQLNGAFGYDLTSDIETLPQVAARLPETGVTSFLATVITSPNEYYPRWLDVASKTRHGEASARVLGAHVEGPYLNPRRPGAHNPAYLRPVDQDDMLRWAASGFVSVMTLAPEMPGGLDAVKALRSQGIITSAGHSDATFDEAMAAFEAGVTWGTHLFNAMSPLNHREPGLPGALLASSVPCGIIADGIHVHPSLIKLAFLAKGAAGLTLVTDAMQGLGMPPGQYDLGGQHVLVSETKATLEDGTLAGSILSMDQAVRNMIRFTGCSLAEAVRMATATPAKVLGMSDRLGSLKAGYLADLVILDPSLYVQATVVNGTLVPSQTPADIY